ncbi:MAG TPA: hypothetical protein PLL69_03060, partial [Gemmatimonadales bacterium]|nr:hypothetical protein [Gemmatimonadales bacterium]
KVPRLERDAFFHANFLEDASFSIALDGQWMEGYLQRREDGTVQLHEIRVLWDISEDALRKWFEEDRSRDEAGEAPGNQL